jgi:hypothetical protein
MNSATVVLPGLQGQPLETVCFFFKTTRLRVFLCYILPGAPFAILTVPWALLWRSFRAWQTHPT